MRLLNKPRRDLFPCVPSVPWLKKGWRLRPKITYQTGLDQKTNTFGSTALQRATICRDSMIRLRIMTTDPLAFFPLHKSDIANTRALLALGYPALGPHLKELLEWLQDGNWPISRPIGEFLLTVPEAIAPLIQEVLAGEDHQWKYWCIVRLIGEMNPKVAEPFRFELLRLAECPTLAEAQSDLDQVSKDALQELWPADYHFSSPPLSNVRQEEKLDSQQNQSVLLAFVRREEDGQNKIYLYGTPDGLRKLASALVKQSESNQDHLADYDTDHTHYRATHQNAILAPSSDEVVLGRLDLRNGELASWAQHRIDNEQLGNGSKPPTGGSMSFPEVLSDLESRPGMFLRKVTYDSVASCIQGFDLGTGFEFLKGFKEWLCLRATFGHNMSWPVLVLYIAFPESKTPWRMLENPDSEQQAIATLFQCLRDFCSER